MTFANIREKLASQDMTVVYVIMGCLIILIYSSAQMISSSDSKLKTIHRLKTYSPAESSKATEVDPDDREVFQCLDRTTILAQLTTLFKIISLICLTIFELVHLFSLKTDAAPSVDYNYFYSTIIAPVVLLPVLVSDMMVASWNTTMASMISNLVSLRCKKEEPTDCYTDLAVDEEPRGGSLDGGSHPEHCGARCRKAICYRGQFFDQYNDQLGILCIFELMVRYVIKGAVAFALVAETVAFISACGGFSGWMTFIRISISQFLIMGVTTAYLRVTSWAGLLSAMGFDLYLRHPFPLVNSYIKRCLDGYLVYVSFRVITYLGTSQMLSNYFLRIEKYGTFQRVDGDSITFFLVLDTAATMTMALWISSASMFKTSLENNGQRYYENIRGKPIDSAVYSAAMSGISGMLESQHWEDSGDERRSSHRPASMALPMDAGHVEENENHYVVAMDSIAGRLLNVEARSGHKRLIRRLGVPKVPSAQTLAQMTKKAREQFDALNVGELRGSFLQLNAITLGRAEGEIWMTYEWPGEGWQTLAYYLTESEYGQSPFDTTRIIMSVIRAISRIGANKASHGAIDPNVSILVRPFQAHDTAVGFDVVFLDWAHDIFDQLKCTTFSTCSEMRKAAETTPWIADKVYCLPTKNNAATGFNSGLKWIAPELLLAEVSTKKYLNLEALSPGRVASYEATIKNRGAMDTYFCGLLLWYLAVCATGLERPGIQPYESLLTDEEVLLRVGLKGARPNTHVLAGKPLLWGSPQFQVLLKAALDHDPKRRPTPQQVLSMLMTFEWPLAPQNVPVPRAYVNEPRMNQQTAQH